MLRFLLLPLLFFGAPMAVADGIRLEKGRYVGPATLLAISPEQLAEVGASRQLRLTDPQKVLLTSAAQTAPSSLEVIVGREARASCTCHTYNVALWLNRSLVQVPHAFLRPDGHPHLVPRDPIPAESIDGFPKTLRVIVDLDGRLRADGRITTLAKIETIIRESQPRIDHIVVLIPPRAPDIALSRKFRDDLYTTFSRYSQQYETGFIAFE